MFSATFTDFCTLDRLTPSLILKILICSEWVRGFGRSRLGIRPADVTECGWGSSEALSSAFRGGVAFEVQSRQEDRERHDLRYKETLTKAIRFKIFLDFCLFFHLIPSWNLESLIGQAFTQNVNQWRGECPSSTKEMNSMLSEVLKKLKRAESRLDTLTREFQDLVSEKQTYLEEIMKGGKRSQEVQRIDRAIHERNRAVSKAKGRVSNLRSQLETELVEYRKELTEERQRELDHYIEQRAGCLRRIAELEVEASRYRYLITGKKDHRLANEENPLPLETPYQSNFVPLDEIIGRIKLELSRISRMTTNALLENYLARDKPDK